MGQQPLPRRSFGETMRADVWWTQPLLVFLGLSIFIVYSTWAAFQGHELFFWQLPLAILLAGNFWRFAAQLVWAEADLVAGLANFFSGATRSLGAGRISAHLLLLPRRLLQSLLGRSAGMHRRRAAQNLSGANVRFRSSCKTFIATFSISRCCSFSSRLRCLESDVVPIRTDFGIGVGTIVLAINVVLLGGYTFGCHSLRHLVGGFRISFRNRQRAIAPTLRELFQSPPHALGVAQFVLGWVFRSLRAAVFDGHLARLANPLAASDSLKC